MEKTAQATTALAYVGQTVAVDGQTATLSNGQATWSFVAPKPVSATIAVKSPTGQTVYSSAFTISAGTQSFSWDGRDNNGVKWPDGNAGDHRQGRQRPDRRTDLPARQDQAGGAGLRTEDGGQRAEHSVRRLSSDGCIQAPLLARVWPRRRGGTIS
jgi:hypothetical protein